MKEVKCKMGVRLFKLTLVLIMLGNLGISAAAEIIMVPTGTPVNLISLETVSSKTAQIGQRVRFSVESDVKVKGKVVVKKGAIAIGEVTEVSVAGIAGTAGKLVVKLQMVEAVDGSNLQISATKGAEGQSKLAQSVAVTALCCVLAIFIKGKDVTFEAGSFYAAYILTSTEVQVD